MSLWGGRYSNQIAEGLYNINSSLSFDFRLYHYDIRVSIAHVKMLAEQDIISQSEKSRIVEGLKEINKELELEIKNKKFDYMQTEDIHTLIENRLFKKIGKTAGKMHTARSRNDQIAVDMKLYLKDVIRDTKRLLLNLMSAITQISKDNIVTIMPGYTHLQRAQPITFAHHLMAYFYKFKRDYERFDNSLRNINVSPLGSCALSGSSFDIDRKMTAEELGFSKIYKNTIDGVSDRDYILEYNFNAATLMLHLSNLSEEIIIWNTSEFSFIELNESYTTGSSIMPQKKNPDLAELTRGKSGRVFGNLMQSLIMLKGLPLAYNKDLQEDKESVFDTIDTIKAVLAVYPSMVKKINVNKKRMELACEKGFINATELANYLSRRNISFRKAHKLVGKLVIYVEKEGKSLTDLSLKELQKILPEYSECFDEDIYNYLDIKNSINNTDTDGGPSSTEITSKIDKAEKYIVKEQI